MLKWYADVASRLRGLLLVILAGTWLVGITLNAWLLLPAVYILTLTVLSLLGAISFWRKPTLRYIALALFCLTLGACRYSAASSASDTHTIKALIGSTNIQVQGTIIDEPRLESQSSLLLVAIQQVSVTQGQSWQELHGEIQVQALGAAFDDPYGPRYGDSITLTGHLMPPPSYTSPEILASMVFPRLNIDNRGGNPLLAWLYQLRITLASIMMNALPQPFAALLIAIFLSLQFVPLL